MIAATLLILSTAIGQDAVPKPQTTTAAPPAAAPTYEVVMDLRVDARGISTGCTVVKNSNLSVDPCESMPTGEPLIIPVVPKGAAKGVVRMTMTAAFTPD